MKLIATMPVRNEDWVLGLSARAALMWCDEICVLNHASTDHTYGILIDLQTDFPGRVNVVSQADGLWAEMSHRQCLLQIARAKGATHIAIVDADEVLTGNLLPAIRELIGAGVPGTVLQLPWLALPRSTGRYLTEGVWSQGQQVSMAFHDRPEAQAHWALHDGRDFHHRNPMGIGRSFRAPLKPEMGGLMHLQFLSERRLRAKQALYKATEVLRWPAPCVLEGQYCQTREQLATRLNWMYGRAVYESDPAKYASKECPAEWWKPYRSLMTYLDVDAPPWQEAELKRLIGEHGREKFRGLDFFGVVG